MSVLLIRDAMSQLQEPELQAIADDAATILVLQGHHVEKVALTMQARFGGGNEAVITWHRGPDPTPEEIRERAQHIMESSKILQELPWGVTPEGRLTLDMAYTLRDEVRDAAYVCPYCGGRPGQPYKGTCPLCPPGVGPGGRRIGDQDA